jgi:hypothetical protein
MDRREFTKIMTAVVAGMAAGTKVLAAEDAKPPAEKHACKGKNTCTGKGGCKAGDKGCSAKNTCSGKGGCATIERHGCKGQNSCGGNGGCSTGDKGCAAKNSCKTKGGCQVPLKSVEKAPAKAPEKK